MDVPQFRNYLFLDIYSILCGEGVCNQNISKKYLPGNMWSFFFFFFFIVSLINVTFLVDSVRNWLILRLWAH